MPLRPYGPLKDSQLRKPCPCQVPRLQADLGVNVTEVGEDAYMVMPQQTLVAVSIKRCPPKEVSSKNWVFWRVPSIQDGTWMCDSPS